MFKAAVITVSDRSFRGERPDTSGPLVVELLQTAGYDVRTTLVVPDEQVRIEAALRSYCDEQPVDLIITTGGTGFSPRDMTPEATIAVCHAAFLYTDYSPEYALPGPSGYPGWDSHRKSPRLSQSRQGKSGSDSPHPGSWVGDAYWRTG